MAPVPPKKSEKIIVGGVDITKWNIVKLLTWADELLQIYQSEKRDRFFLKMLSEEMQTMMRLAQEKLEEANADLWLKALKLDEIRKTSKDPVFEEKERLCFYEYDHHLKVKNLKEVNSNKVQKLKKLSSEDVEIEMLENKTNLKMEFPEIQTKLDESLEVSYQINEGEISFMETAMEEHDDAFEENIKYRNEINQMARNISHRADRTKIEEDWNELLHDLIHSHHTTYEKAKMFYRETTETDIKLISSLKTEIRNIEKKIQETNMKTKELNDENKIISKPHGELQKVCRLLEMQLCNYEKDLKDVGAHQARLTGAQKELAESGLDLESNMSLLREREESEKAIEKALTKLCFTSNIGEESALSTLKAALHDLQEERKKVEEKLKKSVINLGVIPEDWNTLVKEWREAGIEAMKSLETLKIDIAKASMARDRLIDVLEGKLKQFINPKKILTLNKLGKKFANYGKGPVGIISKYPLGSNPFKDDKKNNSPHL